MKHTRPPWTLGRVDKDEQTAEIDALNGHSGNGMIYKCWYGLVECMGSNDNQDKGIEVAEANARFIIKAVNHHDPLTEIVKRLIADYNHYKNDEIGNDDIEWIVSDARKLLEEMEKGND